MTLHLFLQSKLITNYPPNNHYDLLYNSTQNSKFTYYNHGFYLKVPKPLLQFYCLFIIFAIQFNTQLFTY